MPPGDGVKETGVHLAARAKGGIQRTIAVIARQSKIGERGASYGSPYDDLSVRLNDNPGRDVIAVKEVGDHSPAHAEAGVEGTICVISRQSEVGPAVLNCPRHDKFPVRL